MVRSRPTAAVRIADGRKKRPLNINIFRSFKNTTTYFVAGKGIWHDPEIESERREYFSKIKQNQVTVKGIFDYEVFEWGEKVYGQYESENLRFFPKEYSTQASYDVCEDRIVLFPMITNKSAEHSSVITIISKSLTDSYITWFKFLWQLAKPLSEIKK